MKASLDSVHTHRHAHTHTSPLSTHTLEISSSSSSVLSARSAIVSSIHFFFHIVCRGMPWKKSPSLSSEAGGAAAAADALAMSMARCASSLEANSTKAMPLVMRWDS